MPDSAENKPIIPVLTGPTGAGKTAVVNRLLVDFPDLHVISADSRQIYKYLNIGTDKPSKAELDKFNYHLIDFVSPGERFTAFDFVDASRKIVTQLLTKDITPLISGGTGLYIKSLVEGIVELPDDDLSIRQRLEEDLIVKGPKYLYDRLQEVDPDEAGEIHPNNIRKIIRALEIYHLTGRPKSKIIKQQGVDSQFRFDVICLAPSREQLYDNINRRVDRMFKDGLLTETESFQNMGLAEMIRSINVIGYTELFRYLDDQISLSTAINLIKQNSRRFAKRQLTWFRGMRELKMMRSQESAYQYLKGFWLSKIKT